MGKISYWKSRAVGAGFLGALALCVVTSHAFLAGVTGVVCGLYLAGIMMAMMGVRR